MAERIDVGGVELVYETAGEGVPRFIWGHGLSSSRAAEEDGLLVEWDEVAAAVPLL